MNKKIYNISFKKVLLVISLLMIIVGCQSKTIEIPSVETSENEKTSVADDHILPVSLNDDEATISSVYLMSEENECIRKMKRWSYTIKALEDNQATDYLPVLLFLFLFLLLFASYSTRVFAFYMAGTFLMFPGYLDLHI